MTQCSGGGSSSAAMSANGDASRARPLALGGRGSERGAWGVVGGRSAAALNDLPWWLEPSACCTVAGQRVEGRWGRVRVRVPACLLGWLAG
jgi:hypothetical protein